MRRAKFEIVVFKNKYFGNINILCLWAIVALAGRTMVSSLDVARIGATSRDVNAP